MLRILLLTCVNLERRIERAPEIPVTVVFLFYLVWD